MTQALQEKNEQQKTSYPNNMSKTLDNIKAFLDHKENKKFHYKWSIFREQG